LAVNGAEATPDTLVATVIVVVALLKTPLAPDPGAVKVTLAPITGALAEFLTVTASAVAKAVPIVADCGVVPGFVVMDAGPADVLVSENVALRAPVSAVTV
jgi:hypothetical protein